MLEHARLLADMFIILGRHASFPFVFIFKEAFEGLLKLHMVKMVKTDRNESLELFGSKRI